MKYVLSTAFIGLAILANWLASKYTWPVPFTNLVAPAGFYAIGIAFVLRDWLQQIAGFIWSFAVIPIAAVSSYAIAEAAGWTSLQKIAVASLIAFLASETLELVVFTPLRKRSLTTGVLASGMVGNALDSWLFITLSGLVTLTGLSFSTLFWGNFVGKAEMILVGAALTALRRHKLPVAA